MGPEFAFEGSNISEKLKMPSCNFFRIDYKDISSLSRMRPRSQLPTLNWESLCHLKKDEIMNKSM